jgi:hypothetical protein
MQANLELDKSIAAWRSGEEVESSEIVSSAKLEVACI